MTDPMHRRFERLKRQRLDDVRDFHEGIDYAGRWFTPEEIHATCKARMMAFDQLPRKARDRLNDKGHL